MASFVPSKKEASDFNNGVQYVNYDPTTGRSGDAVQAETINNLVESALYSQQVVEQNTTDIEENFEDINNNISEQFSNINSSISTQFATINQNLNTQIDEITTTANSAVTTANSAVTTANAANTKVDNFIASTDAPPPPVGYHYIQFSGESNPGIRWAGTQWTIDTTYNKRTIIGSGGSYTLGATGGSEDAVIVKHYHKLAQGVPVGTSSSGDKYRLAGIMSSSISVQMQDIMGSGYESGTANGVDGTGKNMQPYKVVNIWKRTA